MHILHRSMSWSVLVGDMRESDYSQDPGVDGRILLRLVFRKWDVGGMEWIDLARYRDRRQALVKAIMNLLLPQNAGNFRTS